MPLSTGARIGPYEIVSQFGAGGMGEVDCATDTKFVFNFFDELRRLAPASPR